MTMDIFGKLFGDKGYISKIVSDMLFGNGIQLITAVKRNMKSKALSNEEKLMLRKRSVIETVNDELKNICQIEHTRHRSISGFLLNIISAIAAYSFFPKKPSIKKDIEETNPELIKTLSRKVCKLEKLIDSTFQSGVKNNHKLVINNSPLSDRLCPFFCCFSNSQIC